MVCSNLDESIYLHANLCAELRDFVDQWARDVFTGQLAFDAAVEDLLKHQVVEMMQRCKHVAASGRAMDRQCYVLQGLNDLHRCMADFDYLLENWVSPRRSESPTPRVRLSSIVAQQITDRLNDVPELERQLSDAV